MDTRKDKQTARIVKSIVIILAVIFAIYIFCKFGEVIRGFQDGLNYR